MKERLFKVIGGSQKNQFRGDGKIVNCLAASMGTGGGYIHYLFFEKVSEDEERSSTEG